eukprot:669613_1
MRNKALQQALLSEYEHIQSNTQFKNLTIQTSKQHPFKWRFSVIPTEGTYCDYRIDGVIQFSVPYKNHAPNVHLSTHIPHSSVLSFNNKHILSLEALSNTSNSYSIVQMLQELSLIFNVNLSIPKYNDTIHKRLSATLDSLTKIDTIYKLSDLPHPLVNQCQNNQIVSFNPLQQHIMNDLCLGNDSVIVSPGGCGKSVSVLLSLLYRLLHTTKTENIFSPCHAVIVVSDHIKVETLAVLAEKLGQQTVPHFRVFRLCRHWHFVSKKDLRSTCARNVFVCTLSNALMLFNEWKHEMMDNLVSLDIMHFDHFTPKDMDQLERLCQSVPRQMNVNIFSNSWYKYLDTNVRKLFGYKHKYFLFTKYEHMTHHFVDCDGMIKANELLRFCQKQVQFNCKGIIYVGNNTTGELLQNKLDYHGISCAILTNEFSLTVNRLVDELVDGRLSYLIATKRAPIHVLWKCDINVIIHYELTCYQWYFKRISIKKFSKSNETNVVSFIDKSDQSIYESLTHASTFDLFEVTNYSLFTGGGDREENVIDYQADEVSHDDPLEYDTDECHTHEQVADPTRELKLQLAVKDEQIKMLQDQVNHVNARNSEQKETIQLQLQHESNLEMVVQYIDEECDKIGNRYELDELANSDAHTLRRKMDELHQDRNNISKIKTALKMLDDYSNAAKQYIESLMT